MKIQIKAILHKVADRVVVRLDTDEWYVGTVTSVAKKSIRVAFDDGLEARITTEDIHHVLPVVRKGRWVRKQTDVQAKALTTLAAAPRTPPTPVKVTRPTQRPTVVPMPVPTVAAPRGGKTPPRFMFSPPQAGTKAGVVWKRMTAWIDQIALHYKFDQAHVFKERPASSVAVSREFVTPVGPTFAKYTRAIAALLSEFRASKEWSTQVSAGSTQFFSLDGSYRAAFYNSPSLHSETPQGRKVGMYLIYKP